MLSFVTALHAESPGTAYQARPGRWAVVAANVADLQGPTEGLVRLPLWLFWSIPSFAFDISDPAQRQWLYETVLREASRPEDLSYLDGSTLAALWPDLYLPRGVRLAWEDRHPVLRDAASAAWPWSAADSRG
jgi:hypothetical protein